MGRDPRAHPAPHLQQQSGDLLGERPSDRARPAAGMWPHCSAKRVTMLRPLLANWQLQIPSMMLALLTYLLLARLVLELLFGADCQRGFVRALVLATNPIVRAVGAITPRVVPGALITGCAIFWILTARIAVAQLAALLTMRRHLG
jgi:hypothetical protein